MSGSGVSRRPRRAVNELPVGTPLESPAGADTEGNGALIGRCRDWCRVRSGPARLAVSAILGGLATLSLPPVHAVPVLLPALIGLYWLVQSASRPRAALFVGWAFGFGFFLIGLYWIGNAFMVYAARHAWLAVPAVAGLAAVLGLFTALVCWAQRHVIRHEFAGVGGVLVFAALWTLSEWLRSWVFTGFPWNLIGSAWAFSDAMIQPAAFFGTYGLSLVTVFAFCYPAAMGERACRESGARWRPLGVSVGLLVALWAGGTARLSGAETAYVPDVRLRLVQPNIAQAQKWEKELRSGHVLRQLDMSVNGDGGAALMPGEGPTHVIWAETAVPYVLSQYPELIDLLAQAAPVDGALITGSVRSDAATNSDGRPNYWNSLFAIDAAGDVLSTYDKVHLVPFGEYVPLKEYLPFGKLTAGAGQFTPGTMRSLQTIPGLPPFSPLICYEIIFPGAISTAEQRPAWLLNLTNDAWYGLSAGPYQHFVSARMRAVEEGLPVVRVANTGISGVIDGFGRVIRTLALGEAGVLDARLPVEISPPPYAKYHNLLPLLVGLGFFAFGVLAYRRARRSEDI